MKKILLLCAVVFYVLACNAYATPDASLYQSEKIIGYRNGAFYTHKVVYDNPGSYFLEYTREYICAYKIGEGGVVDVKCDIVRDRTSVIDAETFDTKNPSITEKITPVFDLKKYMSKNGFEKKEFVAAGPGAGLSAVLNENGVFIVKKGDGANKTRVVDAAYVEAVKSIAFKGDFDVINADGRQPPRFEYKGCEEGAYYMLEDYAVFSFHCYSEWQFGSDVLVPVAKTVVEKALKTFDESKP